MRVGSAVLLIVVGLVLLYAVQRGGLDCLVAAASCLKEKMR